MIRERLLEKSFCHDLSSQNNDTSAWCGSAHKNGNSWEKYTLTIEEASKYFRIGEKKLRKLAEENIDAGWVIVNGNRIQIKRKQFEKIIDTLDEI